MWVKGYKDRDKDICIKNDLKDYLSRSMVFCRNVECVFMTLLHLPCSSCVFHCKINGNTYCMFRGWRLK